MKMRVELNISNKFTPANYRREINLGRMKALRHEKPAILKNR